MKSSILSRKTSDRPKAALAVILMSCMLLALTSCGRGISEFTSQADKLPQSNPNDAISYVTSMPIYYRFCDTAYVVSVDVDVTVLSNGMPEAALLRALMSGVGTGGLFSTVIPADCELTDIRENGETLYVTFSDELIDSKYYEHPGDMRMAICEIVNTLTGFSGLPVQILIDINSDGVGERVTYRQLGIESPKYDTDAYASAFTFTPSIVATPEIMITRCLDDLRDGNFTEAALLLSENGRGYADTDRAAALLHGRTFVSYSINDITTDTTGGSAHVDITMKEDVSQGMATFSISITLIKDGGLYLMSYEDLAAKTGA